MPYEIHAYCTSRSIPTIRAFLNWLRDEEKGIGIEADAPGEGAKALSSRSWREFELIYGSEKRSLMIGCYRDTGPESLCAGMVKGRLETVSEYRNSPGKKRVTD